MTDDAFNLYEFPKGHTGRRTYVSVRGHRRSIPVIYTYKGVDGRNYVHPDYGGDWSGMEGWSGLAAPMIMRDIGEYRSVVDNSLITSRSQHREHLRKHNLVEVGNERMPSPRPSTPVPGGVGRQVKQHLDMVKAMPQAQYDQRVAEVTTGNTNV